MSLTAGSRLGPYEILAPLGAGGMGEVYRARDTRLHREVAIKGAARGDRPGPRGPGPLRARDARGRRDLAPQHPRSRCTRLRACAAASPSATAAAISNASRGARAREQIELVVRNRKLFGHYHHAQYDVACVEAFLGADESAIEWLTRSAENGFRCVPVFEADPWLDPLRGSPRFDGLLAGLRRTRDEHAALYREASATKS